MKKITSIFRSWFKSIGNMFTRVNLPKSRNFHVLQTELETNLVLKSCSPQVSVLYLPPVSLGWNLTTRKQEIEGTSRRSPLVESLPSLNKVVVPLFALTGRMSSPVLHIFTCIWSGQPQRLSDHAASWGVFISLCTIACASPPLIYSLPLYHGHQAHYMNAEAKTHCIHFLSSEIIYYPLYASPGDTW